MVAPIRGIYLHLKTMLQFYYIETVVKIYLSCTIDYFPCRRLWHIFPLFFTFTHFAVCALSYLPSGRLCAPRKKEANMKLVGEVRIPHPPPTGTSIWRASLQRTPLHVSYVYLLSCEECVHSFCDLKLARKNGYEKESFRSSWLQRSGRHRTPS